MLLVAEPPRSAPCGHTAKRRAAGYEPSIRVPGCGCRSGRLQCSSRDVPGVPTGGANSEHSGDGTGAVVLLPAAAAATTAADADGELAPLRAWQLGVNNARLPRACPRSL